jgi:hypothetical protein
VAVLAGDLVGAGVDDVAEENRLYGPFALDGDGQDFGRVVGGCGKRPHVHDDLVDLPVAQLGLEGRHQGREPDGLRPVGDDPVEKLIGQRVHDRAHAEVLGLDG